MVLPVPVLVDVTPGEVWDVAAGLNLRTIQLNGRFPASDLPQLAGLTILRALRVERGLFEDQLAELTDARLLGTGVVGAIVLEAATPLPGAVAPENDWEHVIDCKRRGLLDTAPPLITAGGLTSENVGQVIRVLQPHAVDVTSGVEIDMRLKSLDRLRGFCEAVRTADAWA
jgi:phosphoribosylanthranilate isomerase